MTEEINLNTIDKKLDLLVQKVDSIKDCQDDHEDRIRKLEVETIRLTVIFGGLGLVGTIGAIRAFIP